MQSTSITIEWHNWGLCCGDDMVTEVTTVSKADRSIRIHQMNGRRETVLDEKVSVSKDDLLRLFAMIDQIIADGVWKSDYYLDGCDGFMWKLYVRQGNSPQIKVQGAYTTLPYGKEIELSIRHTLKSAGCSIVPKLFCAAKCEL